MKVFTADDLRKQLRQRIIRSGMSQYGYAKRNGIYPTQLTNFLTGQRDTAGVALTKHLGVARNPHLYVRAPRKNGKKRKGSKR